MLTGLNHLTLAVSDLSRSFDFYARLLGFQPVAIWERGAYLALGDLWLCLSLGSEAGVKPAPAYTHYAFSISQSDFNRFTKKLIEGRVVAWQENRSEGDSFYFLDPDGHQLEAHVGSLASRLAECRTKPYKGMRFFD
ncbi:Catechol 2,3-dioxygenase [Duganella sp. CF402]|uniref:fosfomycin resistance glutathione transferase n=1 Tax=unclassified Duganella TaxID=2636909 RepID=UPI0008D7A411|nr:MULTISPECIES: fosfomycin resistance glutathione transferase [unclassified Duganella]RZT09819.1 catechol 2,3-dioxygenase-like lactoylglutathione lyase family enzyme [Duganella sp. BK701]SEL41549.1 Catechol 2,3-dioxygenase [Duganella sp. CF402]